MYHLMIIDDELYARIKLKTDLHLDSFGYIIDQEASNGKDALDQLASKRPDIILVDMHMPVMDGVAFIQRARALYPTIPLIALSGYEDYEYVRSSLKLGAVDYLLKHNLTQETVLAALRRCVEEMERSSHLAEAERIAQSHKKDSEKLHRREAVLKLLHGRTSDCEALARICGLETSHCCLQLILMRPDDMQHLVKENGKIAMVMLGPVITSISQEVINQHTYGLIEAIDESEYVILLSFENIYSQQYIRDACRSLIVSLRQNIEKYTNLTVSFSIGKIVRHPSAIADVYQRARQNMSLSYLTGKSSLISESDGGETRSGMSTLTSEDDRRLTAAIASQNEDACMEGLNAIFERLVHQRADRTSCQIVCIELLNLLSRSTLSIPLCEEVRQFSDQRKSSILASENIADNRQLIMETYHELFRFFKDNGDLSSYSRHTLRAIDYIRKHYMHELSLDGVAEVLNINKSYLSRLFSSDCKKSFTEYVTSYRMEQAKKLLLQGVPIREAAEQVGMENMSYFFRVFKSYTGCTPQQYCEKR